MNCIIGDSNVANFKDEWNNILSSLKHINSNSYFITVSSRNKSKRWEYYCADCDVITDASLHTLKKGMINGCCSGRVATPSNCVAILAPELVKYFKNSNDAKHVTLKSAKDIEFKCPHCGTEEYIKVHNLANRKNKCGACSDGISFPEKLISNLLLSEGIVFTKEKKFTWNKSKKYDFYIDTLNTIIEVHGEQHYLPSRKFKRTLKEEVDNDLMKYNFAIENGIKNYIVLDFRNTNYNNFENQIKNMASISDFSKCDLTTIYKESMDSKIVSCWNLWNDSFGTVEEVAKELGVAKYTAHRWLINGDRLGVCKFNSKQNSRNCEKAVNKPVAKLDAYGNVTKVYKSISEAGRNEQVSYLKIGLYCSGKIKQQIGNINWRYATETEV